MADDQDQRPLEPDDGEEQPGGPADGGAEAAGDLPGGPEPVSEDDIEQLFAEQSREQPASQGTTYFTPEAEALLGDTASYLDPLARQGAEVLGVGLETVAGKTAAASGLAVSVAARQDVAAQWGGAEHIALELRLQLDEVEAFPLVAMVPLAGLAGLLSLDLDDEQLQDPDFAAGQMQMVGTAMRELLDLVSLTLFSDGLSQAEMTFADARPGAVEEAVAAVAEADPDGRLVVAAFALGPGGSAEPGSPDATATQVALVLPAVLPARLAELLGAAPAREDVPTRADTPATAPAPETAPFDFGQAGTSPINGAHPSTPSTASTEAAGDDAPRGFGLTSDPDDYDHDKISPIRPGTTFGTRKGDDVDVHPVRFPSFGEQPSRGASTQSLDLIMDVQMRVSVELGRSSMSVEEVLALGPGSVVELNKLAGEPVDILVNERLIARGEVVVVDENFGVRVTEIISPRRRAQAMGR